MEKGIYLDNAATTYPKPEVVYQAMDQVYRTMGVNAGRGSYRLAQKAGELIEETKNMILQQVHGKQQTEVVFTASATLAWNQILGGMDWKETDTVYVSPYEHNAVMRTLYQQKKQYGFEIMELAIQEDKLLLDLEKIRYQFVTHPPYVVIMTQVSNVTGYILPVEEISVMAKEYYATTMVDAAQAFGLLPIDLQKIPIDFYVFAGHKTPYGPFGIGGFVWDGSLHLKTLLAGGTGSDSRNLEMPLEGSLRYEPGSMNIVAVAGLHAALKELEDNQGENGLLREGSRQGEIVLLQKLTEKIIQELSKIPQVILYLPEDRERHVGIVAFNIKGYRSEDVAMILDEDYEIFVRAGYHCAPLIHKYLLNEEYGGVVRASVGKFNKEEEIDGLVKAVREIAKGE